MFNTECIACDADKMPEEWFAFRVRPRHEKTVALQLRERKEQCFLPLVKETRLWGKRPAHVELPLISGYVFCRANRFRILPILKTPGVIDVIRSGNSPVPVPDAEIFALEQAIKASLHIEECAFVEVGQRVEIQSGPLAGVVGIVSDRRKADCLILSVSLLRRSVSVRIDPSHVAACGAQVMHSANQASGFPSTA